MAKTKTIKLNSIEDVKKFVNIVSSYGNDIDLICGRYTVDAKSIMGIFSLDLTKPVTVSVEGDPINFFEDIAPFVIEEK